MATNNKNTIQAFKSAFNGGTRSNRFEVVSTNGWPTGVSVDTKNTPIKIFSTSIPKAELGTISVGYRGRSFNVAGDRQYQVWQINVYDDSDSKNLWKAFQKWKELMDGHANHYVISKSNKDFTFKKLQKTWILNQLGLNGEVLRTFKLYNCWPTQIGGILLDMSSSTQSSFSVTLTFDWFEITKGI